MSNQGQRSGLTSSRSAIRKASMPDLLTSPIMAMHEDILVDGQARLEPVNYSQTFRASTIRVSQG
jgi:hypothetical protein